MEERGNATPNSIRDPQTYMIIGAAMELHRQLGFGFSEPVYQATLELEFTVREVPFAREIDLPVHYRNRRLGVGYRADFVCFGEVLVELESLERLTSKERSQVINYLSASHLSRGLLLNFGARSLQYQRFVGPSNLLSVHSVKSVGPMS